MRQVEPYEENNWFPNVHMVLLNHFFNVLVEPPEATHLKGGSQWKERSLSINSVDRVTTVESVFEQQEEDRTMELRIKAIYQSLGQIRLIFPVDPK